MSDTIKTKGEEQVDRMRQKVHLTAVPEVMEEADQLCFVQDIMNEETGKINISLVLKQAGQKDLIKIGCICQYAEILHHIFQADKNNKAVLEEFNKSMTLLKNKDYSLSHDDVRLRHEKLSALVKYFLYLVCYTLHYQKWSNPQEDEDSEEQGEEKEEPRFHYLRLYFNNDPEFKTKVYDNQRKKLEETYNDDDKAGHSNTTIGYHKFIYEIGFKHINKEEEEEEGEEMTLAYEVSEKTLQMIVMEIVHNAKNEKNPTKGIGKQCEINKQSLINAVTRHVISTLKVLKKKDCKFVNTGVMNKMILNGEIKNICSTLIEQIIAIISRDN